MQIERCDQWAFVADDIADGFENECVGIAIQLGDHGAMERKQHAIDRFGLLKRQYELVNELTQGRSVDHTGWRCPDRDDGDQIEPIFLRAGDKASEGGVGAALVGNDAVAAPDGGRFECSHVGANSAEGIRFMGKLRGGDSHRSG